MATLKLNLAHLCLVTAPILLLGCQDVKPKQDIHLDGKGEPTSDQGDSEENGLGLAIMASLDYSILKQFANASKLQNSSNIDYPYCLNADFSFKPSLSKAHAKTLNGVANTWISALQGETRWQVTQVSFYEVAQIFNECPNYHRDLRVLKIAGHADLERANAATADYTIHLPKADYLKSNKKILLHEFGHLLGLGDTYEEADYQSPVNQPKAIMKSLGTNGLTDDDRQGIKHVWTRLTNGNADACPQAYRQTIAKENRHSNIFCSPSKSPHRSFLKWPF